jgi:predicted pyridoxine 5'-phosphate oxidase superfamily flavin-nucleotide-binding protein
MTQTKIFHEGELAVQARAGVSDAARQSGRIIRDRLFARAETFIERQQMILCASADRQHDVWASLIQGNPGFIHVADDRTLDIRLDPLRLDSQDPLWTNIGDDNRIGLLLIELDTRKRLRLNGTVSRPQPDRLTVTVQACYPNCPKYIQQRQTTSTWRKSVPQAVQKGSQLTGELMHALRRSDTFFVASAHPNAGVDISHRGGRPGFIHVLDDTTLRIPDYLGNNLFNTLGNFHAHPHTGILVPDFSSGQFIQLIGRPEIEWDKHYSHQATGGTHRYWRLHIEAWRQATLPVHLEWRFIDYSPHLPDADRPVD